VSSLPLKIATLMIVLLTAAVAGGCSSDTGEAVGDASQAAGAVRTAAKGTKGAMAPDFSLKRLDGSSLQLSSLRGKAVIVDFWDTWCPPCIKALPHLQELSVTYGDDLVVVAVALGRDGEDKVRAFTQKHGLTMEVVLFGNQTHLIEEFGGMESIPTTFLLDADGVIQQKWVGAYPKSSYETAVKKLIAS